MLAAIAPSPPPALLLANAHALIVPDRRWPLLLVHHRNLPKATGSTRPEPGAARHSGSWLSTLHRQSRWQRSPDPRSPTPDGDFLY
jgi:hypothetical protein